MLNTLGRRDSEAGEPLNKLLRSSSNSKVTIVKYAVRTVREYSTV